MLLADIDAVKGDNMNKGKVFGKRQLVLALLVTCLAAAVWLNMRFSSLENNATASGGNTGEEQYINNDNTGDAIQVSAGVSYISNSRADRNKKIQDSVSELKTILESQQDSDAKEDAMIKLTEIAENIKTEATIETVIKAKGFKDALVMISDDSVSVIVPVESLLSSETLQIQDAVKSEIEIDLEKIKIITVK